jgi:hypothetical protein
MKPQQILQQMSAKSNVVLTSVPLALAMYWAGWTLPLAIVLLLLLMLKMRFPRVIDSYLSRFVVSALFVFSAIQIAAMVQFFLLPGSGFNTLAAITTLFLVLMVWAMSKVAGPSDNQTARLASRNDLFALVCMAVFVVPASVFIMMSSSTRLAVTGSTQGVDGANHFAMIADAESAENLDYAHTYYPKGFHIATAFIQDSLGIHPSSMDWATVIRFYFGQYVILGALLLWSLYYLAASLLTRVSKKVPDLSKLTVAITIGAVTTLLYLGVFIYNGFLNYFYIISAIAIGAVYLLDSVRTVSERSHPKNKTALATAVFLILTAGVSASWPLLTPPLLMTAALFLLAGQSVSRKFILSGAAAIVGFGFLVHAAPIYFQLVYANTSTDESINLTGGLRVLHIALVLALLGIFWFVVVRQRKPDAVGSIQVLQQVFFPLLLLVLPLMVIQYFLFGEVRYYAIKVLLALEILLVVVAAVCVVEQYANAQTKNVWYMPLVVPTMVVAVALLLLGVNGKPLHEFRSLAWGFSGVTYSPRVIDDIHKVGKLYQEGKVRDFNAITLHANPGGRLTTSPQTFYWVNLISDDGAKDSQKASSCMFRVYVNILRNQSQQELPNQIKECAAIAKRKGVPFFIVSDEASRERIEHVFGGTVKVITQ